MKGASRYLLEQAAMTGIGKKWVIGFTLIVLIGLTVLGGITVFVDPFMHFHKPDTSRFYYDFANPRSVNDGILRHFEYEGLIIGTSMTQQFSVSEAEDLWGVPFVKTPFQGASYKEINNNIAAALNYNPNLRMVIRGLDFSQFEKDKDFMYQPAEDYPTYLYDHNIFNDVKYLWNRDVVFKWDLGMILDSLEASSEGGMTSFDEYGLFPDYRLQYGKNKLYPEGVNYKGLGAASELTEDEKNAVFANVRQNITSLVEDHPDVQFYYFITPYSAVWWQSWAEEGEISKHLQAERAAIEEMLRYDNLHLFSLNTRTDITTDLNNYKDNVHYGIWINSLILKYMHDGKCQLTKDNYEEYLNDEYSFFTSFD